MATRIYKTPFAATGDKEALATADQPDGKVSLQAGWTPDYELPNDNANYRPVGRGEMNGVLNEVTEGLGEIQQFGFAKWQNIDGGWPINAHVIHAGTVYRSTTDNNSAEPGPGVAGWAEAASGRLLNVQTFTTTGTSTYTPTPGTKFILARLIGGGAGGAGAAATSASQYSVGGGGGGGAYSEGRFTIAQVGTSQTVTIGAGGAGGNVGNGAPGGTSSLGSLMTSPGGSAGTFQITTAANTEFGRGAGGVPGTGGRHNLAGIQGQYGTSIGTTGHGGSGGGSAMFGGTGGGLSPAVNNAASSATAPGAGGSGATNTPGNAAQIGGAGMPGALEIREYS